MPPPMATLQPGPIARTPLEHATFESAPHKRTRGPQTLCRTECAMPIQNACKRNTHVAWYRLASLDRHLEAAGVLSCKLESQRPPTMGGQGCVASRSHRRSPRSRARAKAARSQLESFARAIPGTRLLHGRKVSAAYARSLTSYGLPGRGTACSARKGGHGAGPDHSISR